MARKRRQGAWRLVEHSSVVGGFTATCVGCLTLGALGGEHLLAGEAHLPDTTLLAPQLDPHALEVRPVPDGERIALFEDGYLQKGSPAKGSWWNAIRGSARQFGKRAWPLALLSLGERNPAVRPLTPEQQLKTIPGFTVELGGYLVPTGADGEVDPARFLEEGPNRMLPEQIEIRLRRNGCFQAGCLASNLLERSTDGFSYHLPDDPERPVVTFDRDGRTVGWNPRQVFPEDDPRIDRMLKASAKLGDWYWSHDPMKATAAIGEHSVVFFRPDGTLMEEPPPFLWVHRDSLATSNSIADPDEKSADEKSADEESPDGERGGALVRFPAATTDTFDYAKYWDPSQYSFTARLMECVNCPSFTIGGRRYYRTPDGQLVPSRSLSPAPAPGENTPQMSAEEGGSGRGGEQLPAITKRAKPQSRRWRSTQIVQNTGEQWERRYGYDGRHWWLLEEGKLGTLDPTSGAETARPVVPFGFLMDDPSNPWNLHPPKHGFVLPVTVFPHTHHPNPTLETRERERFAAALLSKGEMLNQALARRVDLLKGVFHDYGVGDGTPRLDPSEPYLPVPAEIAPEEAYYLGARLLVEIPILEAAMDKLVQEYSELRNFIDVAPMNQQQIHERPDLTDELNLLTTLIRSDPRRNTLEDDRPQDPRAQTPARDVTAILRSDLMGPPPPEGPPLDPDAYEAWLAHDRTREILGEAGINSLQQVEPDAPVLVIYVPKRESGKRKGAPWDATVITASNVVRSSVDPDLERILVHSEAPLSKQELMELLEHHWEEDHIEPNALTDTQFFGGRDTAPSSSTPLRFFRARLDGEDVLGIVSDHRIGSEAFRQTQANAAALSALGIHSYLGSTSVSAMQLGLPSLETNRQKLGVTLHPWQQPADGRVIAGLSQAEWRSLRWDVVELEMIMSALGLRHTTFAGQIVEDGDSIRWQLLDPGSLVSTLQSRVLAGGERRRLEPKLELHRIRFQQVVDRFPIFGSGSDEPEPDPYPPSLPSPWN